MVENLCLVLVEANRLVEMRWEAFWSDVRGCCGGKREKRERILKLFVLSKIHFNLLSISDRRTISAQHSAFSGHSKEVERVLRQTFAMVQFLDPF